MRRRRRRRRGRRRRSGVIGLDVWISVSWFGLVVIAIGSIAGLLGLVSTYLVLSAVLPTLPTYTDENKERNLAILRAIPTINKQSDTNT